MSKKKAQIWNEHLLNTRNGNFQVKQIILCFLPNFAQNFLYTQNDQTKRKNLLNTQNGNFQVKQIVMYLSI